MSLISYLNKETNKVLSNHVVKKLKRLNIAGHQHHVIILHDARAIIILTTVKRDCLKVCTSLILKGSPVVCLQHKHFLDFFPNTNTNTFGLIS